MTEIAVTPLGNTGGFAFAGAVFGRAMGGRLWCPHASNATSSHTVSMSASGFTIYSCSQCRAEENAAFIARERIDGPRWIDAWRSGGR